MPPKSLSLSRGIFRGVFSKSAQGTGPADWAASSASPPHRHLEEEGAPQSVSGRTRSWPIPFRSDLLECHLAARGDGQSDGLFFNACRSCWMLTERVSFLVIAGGGLEGSSTTMKGIIVQNLMK